MRKLCPYCKKRERDFEETPHPNDMWDYEACSKCYSESRDLHLLNLADVIARSFTLGMTGIRDLSRYLDSIPREFQTIDFLTDAMWRAES